MQKMLAGQLRAVNEEGFLEQAEEWNVEVAQELALELGIATLTEEHLKILSWLREQHSAGIPLTLRKVGSSGVTDIKTFYALFPGKPLKFASKIAGLPKPASCI
jgi:tRNA 2-thiouridine synthesizing protein E